MLYQGRAAYAVHQSMLHCLAITPDQAFRTSSGDWVAIVREWHMTPPKKWRDIGYHYVVTREGYIWPGRPLDQIGAGAIDHNRGVLHIAMVEKGGIRSIGAFSDQYTPAQKQAVRAINYRHGINLCRGHNDVARRLCPGFKVRSSDFVGWPIALPSTYWR